jgi:hypothetical protein
MRLSRAFLVVVDISGYTRFITERTLTLAHAEQVITDLITAVLDQARHPMILNKLEGDAALLFREAAAGDLDAARDVFAQVRSFFPAFRERLARLRGERSNCSCDACSNIADLRLKAFVHVGEIAIKQIRQFEELAGEPVIFLHRLMKNTVDLREYVLFSEEARSDAALDQHQLRPHSEAVDGFGDVRLWVTEDTELPVFVHQGDRQPVAIDPTPIPRNFNHLPSAQLSDHQPGFMRALLSGIRRLLGAIEQ